MNTNIKHFIRYFSIALLALVVDYSVMYITYNMFNLTALLSNNIGLVTGFLVQTLLMIGYVYKKKINFKNIFLFTNLFIVGLIFNNIIFYICFYMLSLNITISKTVAIGITFIINYIIRNFVIGKFGESKV